MISTKAFEGLSLRVYKDSLGFKTIGYGHNLMTPGQRELLTKLNLDYDDICSGKDGISVQQANMLFDIDMNKAIRDVRTLVTDYDSHPLEVQLILNDLCFNLGKIGLSKFKNTLALFNKHDYKGAALALTKSLWFKQVKSRAQIIVEELNSIG